MNGNKEWMLLYLCRTILHTIDNQLIVPIRWILSREEIGRMSKL